MNFVPVLPLHILSSHSLLLLPAAVDSLSFIASSLFALCVIVSRNYSRQRYAFAFITVTVFLRPHSLQHRTMAHSLVRDNGTSRTSYRKQENSPARQPHCLTSIVVSAKIHSSLRASLSSITLSSFDPIFLSSSATNSYILLEYAVQVSIADNTLVPACSLRILSHLLAFLRHIKAIDSL